MPTKEIDSAIAALERQLLYYQNQLDKSIEENEIFLKTKVIYKDLKAVSEKLHELKKLRGVE